MSIEEIYEPLKCQMVILGVSLLEGIFYSIFLSVYGKHSGMNMELSP